MLKKVFILTLLAALFLIEGCLAPVTKRSSQVAEQNNYQKVFLYPMDSVWRAAQLSLKYPIAVNNIENGSLETDFVPALDAYKLPWDAPAPSSGVHYKIILNIVKGKTDQKESAKVTVIKKIERARDFFSEPEPIESDGFEEKMILYRIERELQIDKALKKVK